MILSLDITDSFYDALESLALVYGCTVNDLVINLVASSLTAELLKFSGKDLSEVEKKGSKAMRRKASHRTEGSLAWKVSPK